MATATESISTSDSTGDARPTRRNKTPMLERLLAPIASLKLTVVLFAMSLFIVLAGTFAQTRADIWQVIDEYFRIDFSGPLTASDLFVKIDGPLFFPPAFAPDGPPAWVEAIAFPFPKGWTIGIVLMANLLAAHAVRFKVQARGGRLLFGSLVTVAGLLFTWAVVSSGDSANGFQSETIVSYDTIWKSVVASFALLGSACGWAFFTIDKHKSAERMLVLLGGVASLAIFGTLLAGGSDTRLDDAYMRILWQLIKATMAGIVLLIGCILLFKKRAGIVLLHFGVGLAMVGEILVGLQANESKMQIEVGRGSNFSADTRDWEIAIVNADIVDAPTSFEEAVVPSDVALESTSTPARVGDWPLQIRLRQFEPNSFIQEANRLEEPVGTAGIGAGALIRPMDTSTGTEAFVDMPSAYVDVLDPESGDITETLLLSTWLNEQNVTIADTTYQFTLRFKRDYKSHTVMCNDMVREDYAGTEKARDFSAFVALSDPSTGVRRDDNRIWMNNPLRYAGETFYQADYLTPRDDVVATGIQVVSNSGWMIPYVACMIVAVGMLAQFGQSILRFIDRRRSGRLETRASAPAEAAAIADAATIKPSTDSKPMKLRPRSLGEIIGVALAVIVAGSTIALTVLPPTVDEGEPDIPSFSALPTLKGGRSKPLDTLARNTLLILSDKQTAKRPHPDPEKAADGKLLSASASRWLLDTISESSIAGQYRVFRIEDPEVIEFMGLERREGLIYSFDEIGPAMRPRTEGEGEDAIIVGPSNVVREVQTAARLDEKDRTLFQRKLLETASKIQTYITIKRAFERFRLPQVGGPQQMLAAIESAQAEMVNYPRVIPVLQDTLIQPNSGGWMSLTEAQLIAGPEQFRAGEENGDSGDDENPTDIPKIVQATSHFDNILATWRDYVEVEQDLEEATYDETTSEEMLSALKADIAPAAKRFNGALEVFKSTLITELTNAPDGDVRAEAAKNYSPNKLGYEAFFNRFAPFHVAWILYIIAGVLALLSLLAFPQEFRASAFVMICITFVLHTYALYARIEISGRPPVTNLYSTAVFIGWGAVAFGIALEAIYKIGVGNIIATTAGILTLRIAHVLAADGDTFEVLQAVLDTQFWLATHVVSITLGYSATLVAGLLGAVGIFRGFFAKDTLEHDRRMLARMTYGVTCFAILFSFVGTVLGGLWADDSWGRFWGWDPKENGALMIVLANAIVLHARWGKLIGDRGLFVLAVLSNIVVSWSWFGSNELGVGLHSYGFTEGTLRNLAIFVISQLVIACLAFFPGWGRKSPAVTST